MKKKESLIVHRCGLFIDKIIPYLGSSPDGLIGDDGIVEVKCPYSAAEMTPEEAITAGKIKVLKQTKDGIIINKSHNYFYQIQGQLHITGRQYCVLVLWTKKGMLTWRIERDDEFWTKNMEHQLKNFYLHCLLPELVDPRHTRTMAIRNPEYIIAAQKRELSKKKN